VARIVSIVVSSTCLAGAAFAHPGHGRPGEGFGLAHHLSEPLHVAGIVLAVAAALVAARLLRRRGASRSAS